MRWLFPRRGVGGPLLRAASWVASAGFLEVSSDERDLSRWVRDGAILLDVRTATEFASGHVAGALNYPLGRIREDHVKLDPAQSYVTYCSHGLRSRKVASLLRERGFSRVVNGGPMSELEAALRKDGVLPASPR